MTNSPDESEEISNLTRRPSTWRTAPLDTLFLLGALGAANWFISHADPGWQRLNPTPWILLPLFLGGRYGAGLGIFGAIAAAAAVLALQGALGNMTPQALFTTKPYYFLSFLAAAAAGTLVHHLVIGPSEKLRRLSLSLIDQNQRLQEDSDLYRSNQAQLEETILLSNAELVSLPSELQLLFSTGQDRFGDHLLQLLERECGVISAAIYRSESGKRERIPRLAVTGVGEDTFPEQLPQPDCPLAIAALESGQTATWQVSEERTKLGQPHEHSYLAAIPWKMGTETDSGPRALLLIDRMEFGQIQWETLSRIEAIFAWCMARMRASELGEESGLSSVMHRQFLSADQFQSQIEEAFHLQEKWNLPGQVLVFSSPSESAPEVLHDFAVRLRAIIPPGVPLGAVGQSQTPPTSLGMITPMLTPELAELSARQLIAQLEIPADRILAQAIPLPEAIRLAQELPPTDSPRPKEAGTQVHAAAPQMTDDSHPAASPDPSVEATATTRNSTD